MNIHFLYEEIAKKIVPIEFLLSFFSFQDERGWKKKINQKSKKNMETVILLTTINNKILWFVYKFKQCFVSCLLCTNSDSES